MAKNSIDPFRPALIKWFEDKYYEGHERRDIVVTLKRSTKTYTFAFQNIPIEDLIEMDPDDANNEKLTICAHVRIDIGRWIHEGSWISRFADTSCIPNNGDFAKWAGGLIEGILFALVFVKALHITLFKSSNLYIVPDIYTLIRTELQAWKGRGLGGVKIQNGKGGCLMIDADKDVEMM